MSEPLSDEALEALLAKATEVPLKDGATVVITSKDTSQASAVNAFLLCARPDTVATLVREVQQRRAQVRTLEADNAALVRAMSDADRVGTERPHAGLALLSLALVRPHSGAALLAEMEELRRVASNDRAFADDKWAMVDGLLAEMGALRARVAELEGAQLDTDASAAKTRSELHAMEAQLDYTQTAFMDAQKAIADMETRLETAEHERGELRAGLAEALRERDRARVLLSTSEGNRAQALMDWRAATDAASHARDAALEEAKRVVREAFVLPDGPCSREQYGASVVAAGAIATINKLKSQPARHFVDADEVAKVLRDYVRCMTAQAEASDKVVAPPDARPTRVGSGTLSIECRSRTDAARDIAKRLGLTLDVEETP